MDSDKSAYVYVCVCVCVCGWESERERERVCVELIMKKGKESVWGYVFLCLRAWVRE